MPSLYLKSLVVSLSENWKHIQGLSLADPEYDKPERIDILLGVDIFVKVIRHGRRSEPHNTPIYSCKH